MYRDIASLAVGTLACSTDVCECDRIASAAADQKERSTGLGTGRATNIHFGKGLKGMKLELECCMAI